MHFYFEMRIGFLFLFLERRMKNAISKNYKRKILDYAKWLFEKYKLNSRDFMVYCFLVSTFAFLMHKQYKSPEWKKWMKKTMIF